MILFLNPDTVFGATNFPSRKDLIDNPAISGSNPPRIGDTAKPLATHAIISLPWIILNWPFILEPL